jgi:hypothetical protein
LYLLNAWNIFTKLGICITEPQSIWKTDFINPSRQ